MIFLGRSVAAATSEIESYERRVAQAVFECPPSQAKEEHAGCQLPKCFMGEHRGEQARQPGTGRSEAECGEQRRPMG